MIAYIIGKLIEKEEGRIVLETGGIGYEILVSNTSLYFLPEIGSGVNIYTYLHVKEDALTLFGFYTAEEKAIFMKLIEVNGVGPKSALALLSGIKPSELAIAIAKGDVKALSKIKGLGAKTAERIILELRDRVSAFRLVVPSEREKIDENTAALAADVLVALGVNKSESYRLARAAAKENSTVEEIVANVLKDMG